MQINVLGTFYEIFFVSDNSMNDKDNLGECDRYTKDIRINQSYFEQSGVDKRAMIKTIRHEIIHAFFHEAGLDCYAEDELLVDALAVLFPKIWACCDELAERLVFWGMKENKEGDTDDNMDASNHGRIGTSFGHS